MIVLRFDVVTRFQDTTGHFCYQLPVRDSLCHAIDGALNTHSNNAASNGLTKNHLPRLRPCCSGWTTAAARQRPRRPESAPPHHLWCAAECSKSGSYWGTGACWGSSPTQSACPPDETHWSGPRPRPPPTWADGQSRAPHQSSPNHLESCDTY